MMRQWSICVLLLLPSLFFFLKTTAHPSCVPKNPGDPLTFPSVPTPPLQYCPQYNEWPGACCTLSSEPTDVQYGLEHFVDPSSKLLSPLVVSYLSPITCYVLVNCDYFDWSSSCSWTDTNIINCSATPADCFHNLKVIFCSICDPYSAHLYENPNTTGTVRTFTLLCDAFCFRWRHIFKEVPSLACSPR
jgi:hypothetical protein